MTRDEPMLGATFADRFVITSLIGRGGMASVFRAQDSILGREVAIKVFRVDTANESARFATEVRLLSALNHPNLVTVHDAFLANEGDESPSFLVMELVEGTTVRDAIAHDAMPGSLVGLIAVDMGQALSTVHSAGVTHRDVKPANILLEHGQDGLPVRAKLADFGIAHAFGSTRYTEAGAIVGTAAYLSPEQALGREVSTGSDVYSLGLVLLESLTGRMEFPGNPAESLSARLARDPVMPAGLPQDWAVLLTTMLDRDPANRPEAATVAATGARIRDQLNGWQPVAGAPRDASLATAKMPPPTRVLSHSPHETVSKTRVLPAALPVLPRRNPRRLVALVVAVIVAIALLAWGVSALATMGLPAGTPTQTTQTPSTATHAPASTPTPTLPPAPSIAPHIPPGQQKHKGNGPGKGHK